MLVTLTLIQIAGLVLCAILLLTFLSRSITFNSFSTSMIPGLGGRAKTSPSIVIPITIEEYKVLAQLTVGTAKARTKDQVLKTYVNIFSTLSWAHSIEMCRKMNCDKEPFTPFDGWKSKTYSREDMTIQFSTDTSSIKGVVSEDQFKYGNKKEGVWAYFQFLELTEKSDHYEGYDATLGLNLSEDNIYGHETAVMGMLEQMVDPVFGIHFHKTPQNGEHGSLVVGGKDGGFMEYATIKPHNVLLTDKGSLSGWKIKIDKVVIMHKDGSRKEKELSVKVAGPAPGLEDIILPPGDFDQVVNMAFEKATFHHEGRIFACEADRSSLPDIALVMDGKEYVLSPDDYVRPTSNKPSVCAASIGEYPNKILLGRTFMKKFYTRFDIKKKQLQFAEAKQPPDTKQVFDVVVHGQN